MGWGEPKPSASAPITAVGGCGTTQQIEDAHAAFDQISIIPGPIAVRALAAVGRYDALAGATSKALALLREVWTAGSAEGRLRELWNLCGELDGILDPTARPVIIPELPTEEP